LRQQVGHADAADNLNAEPSDGDGDEKSHLACHRRNAASVWPHQPAEHHERHDRAFVGEQCRQEKGRSEERGCQTQSGRPSQLRSERNDPGGQDERGSQQMREIGDAKHSLTEETEPESEQDGGSRRSLRTHGTAQQGEEECGVESMQEDVRQKECMRVQIPQRVLGVEGEL
jgi:hypothetical protein